MAHLRRTNSGPIHSPAAARCYTYFDPQTGHEFSAVVGATYNLINPATQYKNGFDGHLDWGASQFLSASFQVGAVGYVYDQLTGDSGPGAKLGPFESRVIGIGPQVGNSFRSPACRAT
jgi:hypothetical protein